MRWPLIVALLRDPRRHQSSCFQDGLTFEVGADSRIEKALLLLVLAHPDHIWEPQTTKLLLQLGRGATNIIVGGAYIGDQVLPLARVISDSGSIHAFEPMADAFKQLVRNVEINGIRNVVANPLGLWDSDEIMLEVAGDLALASSGEATIVEGQYRPEHGGLGEIVQSVTISRYVAANNLASVELIMLDTEGGEEHAPRGATLAQPRYRQSAQHRFRSALRLCRLVRGTREHLDCEDAPDPRLRNICDSRHPRESSYDGSDRRGSPG